ncbi:hypothetical protein [Pelomonas sp. BJYL3]|uniref:hypothetical protein n=1 Tax=Pelomonas sp. BJYL3 TaxID=2976697 RepID=UPI0022B2FAC8|nr:hypothetical protein [Pelomonas sp. BJYL3]
MLLVLHKGRISPDLIGLPTGPRHKRRLQNKEPGPIEFENLDLRIGHGLAEGRVLRDAGSAAARPLSIH